MKQEVDYIFGTTRIFAILGDPIVQVRSPEMITAQFVERKADAILIPIHAPRDDFDRVVTGLMAAPNVGGLVFTIPFKTKAIEYADRLGPQAETVRSLNALARLPDGKWIGEIFDGVGCVAGLRGNGFEFAGKTAHLIGAGGAGSAIAAAIAHEHPARLRIWDMNRELAARTADKAKKIDPAIEVEVAPPDPTKTDILLNATPVGMLNDPNTPIPTDDFPSSLVVFDAIVKPEETPLLRAAKRAGCKVVGGREMMRGQVSLEADFLLDPAAYAAGL